jgi:hypothetical protein
MDPVIIDAASGQLIDGTNRVRACGRLGIEVAETRYQACDRFDILPAMNGQDSNCYATLGGRAC